MLLSDIQEAVISRIESALAGGIAGVSDLKPVSLPFVSFDKPENGGAYTELQIVPNDTRDVWCGTVKSGNILLNTSFPRGDGIKEPTKEGEKYLKVFSEGLVFDGVTIPDEGTIYNAVPDQKDSGRYFIPTVIKFEAR